MELSKRLTAVAALVTAGSFIADIGTDHGYVPIYLMKHGRIRGAVAADVNQGPLERARMNIVQEGLEGSIKLRLSDGLKNIGEEETDVMVAAGMGGGLIARILEEGGETAEALKECILQPQSEVWKVREYLAGHGWAVTAEDMVEEDHKFYPMIKAVRGLPEYYEEYEYIYGKKLLEMKHPVLKKFLLRERGIQEDIRHRLMSSGKSSAAELRLLQLEDEMKQTKRALECYGIMCDEKGRAEHDMQRDNGND